MTEDDQERISIIAEGNRISQTDAEIKYEAMNKSNPYADLELRAKQRKIENRMRKNLKLDNKSKASGE